LEPIGLWVLGAAGLFFSIFFAAALGALRSYSKVELESRFRSPASKKRVKLYIERTEQTILSVRVLKALSNILLVISVTFLVGMRVTVLWAQVLLSLLLSLVVLVLFAEVVPGALARRRAEKVLKVLFPVFDAFSRAIRPFTAVVNFVLKVALRVAGIREKENGEEEIEKEILEAVSEGEREGYIKQEDRSMIASILDFRDQEVSSVMTPRTEMVSIPDTASLDEAIAVARDKGHSRIPVHRGNRDSIVGVIYAKDILFAMANGDARAKPVTEIMRKPFFVPESKRLTTLLREFQNGTQHISIVLDEYGGTAGLVTVEDLLEEIVGEIADEYDFADEDFYMKQLDDSSIVASGVARIDDVNDELDIRIPEDQGYDTVAGFISHSMGRIPAAGEEYVFQDATFTVLDADERRIRKVKVVVRTEPEED
jgi:putative hemolysin